MHNLVSSSPHIKGKRTVNGIMLDVIIALMPMMAVSVWNFGVRALALTMVSVLSCVFFEWAFQKAARQRQTIEDLSACVTGILIAFNMPVSAPYWAAVVASFFAIVIVKQLFGGIGHNFVNPALAARAFLMASWPDIMTTWYSPGSIIPIFGKAAVDAVTSPTPLAVMAAGAEMPSILQLFIGTVGGCIGETSALCLILGGVYLMARKVITPTIPLSYIGTVFVLALLGDGNIQQATNHILSGGLMLGAFFMATDYTTCPIRERNKLIMGIGCGVLTMAIRNFGGYPEGVSYSILFMNLITPLLDRGK